MEVRRRDVKSDCDTEDYDSNNIYEKVQQVDAFVKYPPECTIRTVSGGGLSIITFTLIAMLVIFEVNNFYDSEVKFSYHIDSDFDKRLKMNIDIIIASPCRTIGADVLDVTGSSSVESEPSISEDETWFEMSPNQLAHFNSVNMENSFRMKHHHALKNILWKHSVLMPGPWPKNEVKNVETSTPDACRLHGSITVPKVSGNLHVISGKPIQFEGAGHLHISIMGDIGATNFSHRINHFSFGDSLVGRINPLDGTEHVTPDQYTSYTYFVQAVPTNISTSLETTNTYQYSYTQHVKVINHRKGSHGINGIFFRYDFFPFTVSVTELYMGRFRFVLNLFAGVGGIFATSSLIQQLFSFVLDILCCRVKIISQMCNSVNPTASPLPQKVEPTN